MENVQTFVALVLIVFSSIPLEFAECRARPNTNTVSNCDSPKPTVEPVFKSLINFEDVDEIQTQAPDVETGIHFPTDAEIEAELHSRHPSLIPNFDKLMPKPSHPRVPVPQHTEAVESGRRKQNQIAGIENLQDNSLEALDEFIKWATDKGIPPEVLAAIEANKAVHKKILQSVHVGKDAEADFSILGGESLPCESEDHVKGADGICREVVGF